MITDQETKRNKRFVHSEGQGKDFVRQKIRQPKRGRGGRGVWGNSAAPEPEAKPRRLPEALRAETSKNIFFSLIEKMGVAREIQKCKENVFAWHASFASGGEVKRLVSFRNFC